MKYEVYPLRITTRWGGAYGEFWDNGRECYIRNAHLSFYDNDGEKVIFYDEKDGGAWLFGVYIKYTQHLCLAIESENQVPPDTVMRAIYTNYESIIPELIGLEFDEIVGHDITLFWAETLPQIIDEVAEDLLNEVSEKWSLMYENMSVEPGYVIESLKELLDEYRIRDELLNELKAMVADQYWEYAKEVFSNEYSDPCYLLADLWEIKETLHDVAYNLVMEMYYRIRQDMLAFIAENDPNLYEIVEYVLSH